ncbi:hypothetical protein K438DRAFT_1772356 [Mycena galopus ATCC 62051]|nr:hypothetical protein K438DRAFT_1772356 [Mycena galopus ATCC 62051]
MNNLKPVFLCSGLPAYCPPHIDSQEQHQVRPDGIARAQQQSSVPKGFWGVGILLFSFTGFLDAAGGGMNWKSSSLSDTCLVHSVALAPSALLRESVPLLCTPTVSRRMPGAFFHKFASQEAQAMVEIGRSAEHLSQQLQARASARGHALLRPTSAL